MEPQFSNRKRTPQCSAVTFHPMTSTLLLVPVTRKPQSMKSFTSELVIIELSLFLFSLILAVYICVLCDRRPCTNVVNLFVNKCSPCLPLHPAHLDAKRRRRRRRKRSETFLPSSCLEAALSKLTLTLPHHSLARSSLEDYSSNIYIPVCMCSMMCVSV